MGQETQKENSGETNLKKYERTYYGQCWKGKCDFKV